MHMRPQAALLIALIPTLAWAAPETKPCSNGLIRTKVASAPLLKNPVALSVDVDGSIYVTETERRKVADLDIREVTWWIPDDLSHSSIEEKRDFFRKNVTSKRFQGHQSVKDSNADGRIDWKDLTTHTEKIHRLVDSDGDGIMDTSTVFAEGFNTEVTGIAAGVLAHRGDVFATIAPDVWKLRDTTGNGKADQRESIAHGFGVHINYAGHDMHGLTFGPDGRLYWTIGDKGTNVVSKEGTRYFFPHEGAVLRCDPDGSNFEVFARGLRNVQEIAFDEFGNLFGVDNDSDRAGEKERLVFISEASDSGWRVYYQYRDNVYNPWMDERIAFPDGEFRPAAWLPPVSNYLDGPAGFSYNPGTALSERYRGSFFLSQFPAGKINAFKTEADGAGFRMTDDHLVAEGDAFVGSNFGPDGALYVVDWQGGYPLNEKGAVWKIDDPESADTTIRQEVARFLRDGPSKVESMALLRRLGHPDQRIRLDAQWELARRGEWSLLKQAATSPGAETVTVAHALWGLSQGKQFDPNLFAALSQSNEPEVRAQAAKWAGECKVTNAELGPLLADPSPRVRYHAALAVAKTGASRYVANVVAILSSSPDAWLRHAAATALASAATPAELASLRTNPIPEVRRAAVIASKQALERLYRVRPKDAAPERNRMIPYENVLSEFLRDKDPAIVSEAAIAIHSEPGAPAALPVLADLLRTNPLAPEPAIRRAISAARQLATPRDLLLLANYAANSSAPETLRLRALDVLKSAAKPFQLDPVDGHWIDLPEADLSRETRRSLGLPLATISGSSQLVKTAGTTIDAVGERLNAKQLAARATDTKLDPSLRLLALASLKPLDEAKWKSTAIEMIRNGTPPLRMQAARQLASSEPAAVTSYISNLGLPSKDLTERQHAVSLLSHLKNPEAHQLLTEVLAQASDSKIEAALLLEILEAAKANGLETTKLESLLNSDSRHLHTGGDSETGRRIFEGNLSANCTACHRMGPVGSEVGPPLTEVGKKDRAYIVESLINPQAQISEGYPTPSSMPPMSYILSPREIRDLVAFLAAQD
ncbi:PVC-type heme-binding CxxCH protein [Haloferula sp.]|uniref:PVC-type heme-binding CxxCH protein n=1 Tax=Haloferula sp. TaxID=2497595 RepID=UPI003C7383CA